MHDYGSIDRGHFPSKLYPTQEKNNNNAQQLRQASKWTIKTAGKCLAQYGDTARLVQPVSGTPTPLYIMAME